jgi:putative MFS transporter
VATQASAWRKPVTDLTPSQGLTSLLDGSPVKPIQRWLWVLSTGGTFLDGFVIFVLGVAMPLIIAQFHLQPDLVGLIGASLVFGAVFGAGFGGPMADRLGRKKLMLADMIIIAAGAAISALANGFPTLFLGQLLVGVGVGIDFPASSSYVSEVLPKRSRARMMVATIACQSVGMLLAAVITLVLLKTVHGAQNWRLFLATEGVIAVLFFLLRLSEPDSPHWLMNQRRFAEAAQAFIRIVPEQRQAVLQISRSAGNERTAISITPQRQPGIGILFSRSYRARTVLVAVPWF